MVLEHIRYTSTARQDVPIEKSREAFEYFKAENYKIQTDKGLNTDGKIEATNRLLKKMDQQFGKWKEEMDNRTKEVDDKKATVKPPKVSRKFEADQLAAMNYQAKVYQSRFMAEGDKKEGFDALMQELVVDGDESTRQMFLDHFVDFSKIAEGFKHSGTGGIKDYYKQAKELVKTPEERAYEAEMKELDSERTSLNTQWIAAERSYKDFKGPIAASVWGTGEVFKAGEEEETPDFWQ